MFRPYDSVMKQQVDYKHPGKSGINVFWNFGQLNAIDKKYTVKYQTEEHETDTIIGTEHNTNYYYLLHEDSLMLTGYENQTTIMNYEKPELLLHFPVAYGDSISSYYFGKGKYCEMLDMQTCGTSKSVADAYGMLILPNGDTLRHVIRVHTVKLISERMYPIDVQDTLQYHYSNPGGLSLADIQYFLNNDSIVLKKDIFRWYAAGYRYPIFETVTTGKLSDNGKTPYFSTAFFYPPADHAYLAHDEENRKIQEQLDIVEQDNREQEKEKNPLLDELSFRYNFYPNPVHTTLFFDYFISKDAMVSYELYSLSGILALRTNPENVQSGAHEFQIDMSQYSAGTYILRMLVDKQVYSEKIIKK